METVKTVQIPEEINAYLQRLNFEAGGLRALICQLVHDDSPKNELFEHLKTEYKDTVAEYRFAEEELVRQYAPEYAGKEFRVLVHSFTNTADIWEVPACGAI